MKTEARPVTNVREVILRCATRRFAEQGYAGTSVREVAGDAGISLPMLYYYFGNKEKLYRTVIDQQLRSLHEILTFQHHPSASARQRIERYVRTLYELYIRDGSALARLLIQSSAMKMPMTAEMVRRYQWAVIKPLAEHISFGVGTGEFRAVDPDVCAEAILALVFGFARARAPGIEKHNEDTVVSQVMDIYLKGLAPSQLSMVESAGHYSQRDPSLGMDRTS